MLNIVLFGPPGAGKGTQSAKLINKYALVHLSTGDIFRANIKNQTALGNLAKSYIDKGQLVPDEVTIQMLESECNKHPKAKGFIFDGFPRTHAQAAALDTFLKSKGTGIGMMLALEVEEEELRKRLLLRGKESGRADDQDPAVIQKRIDVYNAETMPVKAYYNAQKKYFGVNGIGKIDTIFNNLCRIIDTYLQAAAKSASKKIVAKKTAAKKSKKLVPVKKTAKKVAKKQAKRMVKKATNQKTAKKITKKVAKKQAKRVAKKVTIKKTVKKTAKKLAKKQVKQVVKKIIAKKAGKKAAKKTTKKASIKRITKKGKRR